MSGESSSPRNDRRHKVSDQAVAETILSLAAGSGPAGSINPNDVAKALAGADWQALTGRVRRAAVRLAEEGRLVILRKGKPADPADFKGVYRLRIGAEAGPAD
jgi:hypothetical protein